jgi:hypothetical protein
MDKPIEVKNYSKINDYSGCEFSGGNLRGETSVQTFLIFNRLETGRGLSNT